MDKLRTDVGINPSVNAVGVATSLYTREADYTPVSYTHLTLPTSDLV